MYEALVAGVKKIPKVKKVAVISSNREIVGGDDLGENLDSLGNVLETLASFSDKMGEALSSFQMETPDSMVFVEAIEENKYLLVIGEKTLNRGRVRLELRKHVKK